MPESILSRLKVCPECKTSYLPENGEVCQCPEEPPRTGQWDEITEPEQDA